MHESIPKPPLEDILNGWTADVVLQNQNSEGVSTPYNLTVHSVDGRDDLLLFRYRPHALAEEAEHDLRARDALYARGISTRPFYLLSRGENDLGPTVVTSAVDAHVYTGVLGRPVLATDTFAYNVEQALIAGLEYVDAGRNVEEPVVLPSVVDTHHYRVEPDDSQAVFLDSFTYGEIPVLVGNQDTFNNLTHGSLLLTAAGSIVEFERMTGRDLRDAREALGHSLSLAGDGELVEAAYSSLESRVAYTLDGTAGIITDVTRLQS